MGLTDIVGILLDHGANLSVTNNRGHTPLYAAALGGHRDVVKMLMAEGADHGKAPSPLHFVKDPGVLAVLLEDGADVDATTKDGDTPLLAVLSCGYIEVICSGIVQERYRQRSQIMCQPHKGATTAPSLSTLPGSPVSPIIPANWQQTLWVCPAGSSDTAGLWCLRAFLWRLLASEPWG